jgi:hypothetical protein
MRNDKLLRLVLLATLFGIGHHVDHIIRGNHVGWPLIPQITPFTYSLIVYPFIALGLYLYLKNSVGAGYWALLTAAGLIFVGLLHFGPFAVEPPADIIGPYKSRVVGWLALCWLIMFLLILAGTAVYGGYLWVRQRQRSSASGGRA